MLIISNNEHYVVGSTPHRVPSGSSLANLDWPSDTSSSFGSISTQSPFEASWTSIPAPVPPPVSLIENNIVVEFEYIQLKEQCFTKFINSDRITYFQ